MAASRADWPAWMVPGAPAARLVPGRTVDGADGNYTRVTIDRVGARHVADSAGWKYRPDVRRRRRMGRGRRHLVQQQRRRWVGLVTDVFGGSCVREAVARLLDEVADELAAPPSRYEGPPAAPRQRPGPQQGRAAVTSPDPDGVRFTLEPRGYDFGQVIEYDLVVDGDVVGRVWTEDGASWGASVYEYGAQTFPGPSAERAGYWAASWLAQGGQPGPRSGLT